MTGAAFTVLDLIYIDDDFASNERASRSHCVHVCVCVCCTCGFQVVLEWNRSMNQGHLCFTLLGRVQNMATYAYANRGASWLAQTDMNECKLSFWDNRARHTHHPHSAGWGGVWDCRQGYAILLVRYSKSHTEEEEKRPRNLVFIYQETKRMFCTTKITTPNEQQKKKPGTGTGRQGLLAVASFSIGSIGSGKRRHLRSKKSTD